MKKRSFLIVFFILLFCLSSCNTRASKDFSSIVLNPDKYRFSDNWAELQQEGDILLFY